MDKIQSLHHPPKKFMVIQSLTHIKLEAFTALSGAAGALSSVILFFQGEELGGWLNTAIVVAFVTAFIPAFFLLILKLVDIYHERQKAKDKDDDEAEARHFSYSEKLAELTVAERARLLADRESSHKGEIEFFKYQLEFRKLEAFEARMSAHALRNEMNLMNAHIWQLHNLMSNEGIPIPEFSAKTDGELTLIVAEQVAEYKAKLEREKDQIVHLSG